MEAWAGELGRRPAMHERRLLRRFGLSILYSVLHAAKAVMQTHGFSARSHAGVRGVFGLHIVNAGLVERRWGAVIGQLRALREVADYQVTAQFDETDARDACQRAASSSTASAPS